MGFKSDFQRTAQFISSHPVGRQQPVKAWWRWLQWQLRSRLTTGPHSIDWIAQTKLIVDRRMTGATGNIYCGLHEFSDMALAIHFLSGQSDSSKALFVDVGANVGSCTTLAAGVAGSHVVCIEPSPTTFSKLLRNIEANQLQDRVTAVQAAVGEMNGEIRFSLDRDCENQVVDDSYQGSSGTVPLRTIDDILDGRSPIMMKLDVEGFEQQAIAGAKKTIANSSLRALLLETVDQKTQQFLSSNGFVRAYYDPMTRCVASESSAASTGNELWVRDQDQIALDCQNAPTIDVCGIRI